jgi:hypothetical protein
MGVLPRVPQNGYPIKLSHNFLRDISDLSRHRRGGVLDQWLESAETAHVEMYGQGEDTQCIEGTLRRRLKHHLKG